MDVFKVAQPEIAPPKALYYNVHYEQLKKGKRKTFISKRTKTIFKKKNRFRACFWSDKSLFGLHSLSSSSKKRDGISPNG
nr:hypothetical protein [Atopobacter phocae]